MSCPPPPPFKTPLIPVTDSAIDCVLQCYKKVFFQLLICKMFYVPEEIIEVFRFAPRAIVFEPQTQKSVTTGEFILLLLDSDH